MFFIAPHWIDQTERSQSRVQTTLCEFRRVKNKNAHLQNEQYLKWAHGISLLIMLFWCHFPCSFFVIAVLRCCVHRDLMPVWFSSIKKIELNAATKKHTKSAKILSDDGWCRKKKIPKKSHIRWYRSVLCLFIGETHNLFMGTL